MRKSLTIAAMASPVAGLLLATASFAASAPAPQPDNSKVNTRDNAPASPTADQQPNDDVSLETTRAIRAAIVGEKDLSTYAHNVKIVTQNGEVVLRGPVRSPAEKQRVETVAEKAAGTTRVRSELEVTKK